MEFMKKKRLKEYIDTLNIIDRRNKRIVWMHEKGASYEEIAKKYRISKQRVFVIVKREKGLSTDEINQPLDKIKK